METTLRVRLRNAGRRRTTFDPVTNAETTASLSALADLHVVDFSAGPAAGLASTVLADFGATVTKVEPTHGDRFRSMASSPFWLRGKHSATIDLNTAAGRSRAHQLAAGADIVLVSGSPDRLARWQLDADSLRPLNPALIHCAVTGWGMRGPYAELPGYEGLVAAKAGRMANFDVQLDGTRPVYSAVQVATHVCSQAAVQGICAAVFQRHRTGQGASVETSLLQALMPFDLVDLLSNHLAERDNTTFTPLRRMNPMPTLNYHPLRTSDGTWIQCGNLLEHLFLSFLDATDLLGELLIDERFQAGPAEWSPDAIEHARDRMLERMQQKTAAEWMAIFADNGNVAAEPIVTTADALEHPDLVVGNGLVQLHDDRVGTTTQLGPIAELSHTPAVITAGAPSAGEHTDRVLQKLAPASPAPPMEQTASDASPDAPLAGLTILDLSTIIAAPLGVSMLADLGARVIKIEPLGGDPFRGLLTEGRMAVKTNVGKESICVDLKTAEGQRVVHELVAHADVLVHNFRGAVPAKLGIDHEQVSAINPRLISTVVNGYGPHGPGATRPATHPVMGACTGGVAMQAGSVLDRQCDSLEDLREASRQIMAANESNPDPNTSVVAASAILIALLAREHTGRGQVVRVNMQVANGWANYDDFLHYDGKPPRAEVDDEHCGIDPLYRLYPCEAGWVFLAAVTDDEFRRLCAALDRQDLAGESRFATRPERVRNASDLAAELGAVFATQPAPVWEAQLGALGVGCVQADGSAFHEFLASDEHIETNAWLPMVTHQRFGRHPRWGPVVTVNGVRSDYRSAPLAGEHTDELLHELGYDDTSIEQLRASRVVASEPVEPTRTT